MNPRPLSLPFLLWLLSMVGLQGWLVYRELSDPPGAWRGDPPELWSLLWPMLTLGMFLALLLWELLHRRLAPRRYPGLLAALALLPLSGAGVAYALRGVSTLEQDRAHAWSVVAEQLSPLWAAVPCPPLPGWTGDGRCFATRADAAAALRRLQARELGQSLTLNAHGDVRSGAVVSRVRAPSGRTVPFEVSLVGRELISVGEPSTAGQVLTEAGLFSVLRLRAVGP